MHYFCPILKISIVITRQLRTTFGNIFFLYFIFITRIDSCWEQITVCPISVQKKKKNASDVFDILGGVSSLRWTMWCLKLAEFCETKIWKPRDRRWNGICGGDPRERERECVCMCGGKCLSIFLQEIRYPQYFQAIDRSQWRPACLEGILVIGLSSILISSTCMGYALMDRLTKPIPVHSTILQSGFPSTSNTLNSTCARRNETVTLTENRRHKTTCGLSDILVTFARGWWTKKKKFTTPCLSQNPLSIHAVFLLRWNFLWVKTIDHQKIKQSESLIIAN